MQTQQEVCWFGDLRSSDIARVGGKNAALGELYSVLAPQGIRVPNGFALTADLYRAVLTEA
ncbi:MAG: PEP/pyruvate-binding domain-containing protein, partial [Enhydrobacter sp.]